MGGQSERLLEQSVSLLHSGLFGSPLVLPAGAGCAHSTFAHDVAG